MPNRLIIGIVTTLPLFSLAGLSLAQTPSAPQVETKATACQPTSRSKPFPTQSYSVLLGGGEDSSDMTQIQFTLIESMYENCRIETTYALDYHIYNHWQSAKNEHQEPGGSSVHINLMSGGRNVLQDAAVFPAQMGFCGPDDEPEGRHFHLEGKVTLNLIDITDAISISADRVSGGVGKC